MATCGHGFGSRGCALPKDWVPWPHSTLDLVTMAACGMDLVPMATCDRAFWLPWMCVAMTLVALAMLDQGFGYHGHEFGCATNALATLATSRHGFVCQYGNWVNPWMILTMWIQFLWIPQVEIICLYLIWPSRMPHTNSTYPTDTYSFSFPSLSMDFLKISINP